MKPRRKRHTKRSSAADKRVKLGRHPLGSFAGGQQGPGLKPPMQKNIKCLLRVVSLLRIGQSGVS